MIVRTVLLLTSMTAFIHVGVYILETTKRSGDPRPAPESAAAAAAADDAARRRRHGHGHGHGWLPLDTLLFIQRREHASQACRTYASLHRNVFDDTKDLDHILVDERHRLLYCYVPKVACTNWKRVFAVLLGAADQRNASRIPAEVVHRRTAFPRLSDYTVPQVRHFVDTFTKYLFVRHPFERLLSAYRNKLEAPSDRSRYFRSRIGRDIVRQYRANASRAALLRGDDVTFGEFAAYLVDHYVPAFNEHWRPVSELCYPCLIRYDFIGKYETLQTDAEFLLKAINHSHIRFPQVRRSNTTARIAGYYNALAAPLVARLYNIFVLDFKLFSYTTENILGYEIG